MAEPIGDRDGARVGGAAPLRRGAARLSDGWRTVRHRWQARWWPATRRGLWRVRSSRRLRRSTRGLLVVLVALTGAALGVGFGSPTDAAIGPFNAELRLSPSTSGETAVRIPPLGSLHLDSHDGPAELTIDLAALDQARTQQMITDPGGITRAAENVGDDVLDAVVRTALAGLGAGVLGAMLLAALVFRTVRTVAAAGVVALVVTGGSIGTAAATLRLDALAEPRYEGLLVNAPAVIGDVQQIADDYQRYTEQLQSMVANVSTVYTTASTLETFAPQETGTRVLHVSDLHLNPAVWPIMRTVVEQYGVDLVIDSGDIVDWGTDPESQYLTSIRLLGVPYVYVRGNHDSTVTQQAVAEQPNAVVLDDGVTTVAGLTIAGIGDPRFTPDQRTRPFSEEEQAAIRREVTGAGSTLASTVRAHGEPVDVAVVHDPLMAQPLDGAVPVVLSGHAHDRRVGPVAPPADPAAPVPPDETLLMVQGSTGGAGLRGLEGEHPEPLALSVLYFSDEQQLIAYDDITVTGVGQSEVSVERHVVEEAESTSPTPSPSPTTGGPAGTTPTPPSD